MCTCLISRCKPCRISLVLVLSALLSAWTCTAIIDFNSCTDAVIHASPNITVARHHFCERSSSFADRERNGI